MLEIIKDRSFYVFLMLKYYTPIFLVAILIYWKKIFRIRKYLLFVALFAIIAFFIVDPIATYWEAWGFDYDMTLNIRILGNSVLEELVWAILLCLFVGIVISVWKDKVDNQRPFFVPYKLYSRIKSENIKRIISKMF
jgi:hypothetical protein